MTFHCTGESFCGTGSKAVVNITAEKQTDKINFDETTTPLCVTKLNKSIPDPDKKCFRFWGNSSVDGLVFEHFVCARSAAFQPDASLKNNGAWLVADGVIQNGTTYFYWSGFHEGATHTRGLEIVGSIVRTAQSSTGLCDCTTPTCEITILDKDGNRLTQKTKQVACSEVDVKAGCDGCPPGQCKCTQDKYPGYCCLPCAETAAKINNLASKAGGCCNG